MKLTREAALELLHSKIKNERMIAHSLASEVVLKALATELGADGEIWGQAGLLHDIDVEFTEADPLRHGLVGAGWLADLGVETEIVDAIALHNEMAAPRERNTVLEHALAAGETITGLIMATARVYPDKKVASVKPSSVVKRMKEKAFAASVKRENIMECEAIGIPLPQFAALAITAMSQISDQLGL
jgi:putative nucleotidyltransferase with HDIG domain